MQIRQVAGPISLLVYDKSSWKLACRLAKSRPLGERSELFWPRSGDRERRSCERSTCLAWWVFICITRQKWEWRDSHLGFQVSFASPWLQWRNVLIPLPPNLLNVYVYLHHRRSKFVYCVRKLFLTVILGESWRPQAAGKKQKLVSISSQYWERRFHNQGILDIRTHFKPTETFQYTHFSSCNPHGVRTNSSAKSFYENIYNFKKRLRARSYPHNPIEKITFEVKFTERKSASLKNNEVRKKILPFVTTYHPALQNLKNILTSKWHLLISSLKQNYKVTYHTYTSWPFNTFHFAIDLKSRFNALSTCEWQLYPQGSLGATLIGPSAPTRFWVGKIGANQVWKVLRPAPYEIRRRTFLKV